MMKRFKDNYIAYIILFTGFILRFISGFFSHPMVRQHDVMGESEWFEYAMYILRNWSLPLSNYRELHQPPVHSIIQALLMKIICFFKSYPTPQLPELYANCKYLSIIYSILTLIIIKKLLDEFDIINKIKNIILIIVSIYPGYILMVSQYGNDNLAFLFFILSLYLTIKWYKNPNLKNIILLALAIGFGMLTKVSVGLIAIIAGPLMLYKLFNKGFDKNIFKMLIIFGIIVFPLGLCYEIRNMILFGQTIGTVPSLESWNPLYIDPEKISIVKRMISFPLDRLCLKKELIYHSTKEYNIWIDLIKTATFDEITKDGRIFILDLIVYIVNILFFFSTFAIFIVLFIKKTIFTIKNGIKAALRNHVLLNLSLILYIVALVCYVMFNIKYPASCSSNWRYIPYITFAQAILLAYTCDNNL